MVLQVPCREGTSWRLVAHCPIHRCGRSKSTTASSQPTILLAHGRTSNSRLDIHSRRLPPTPATAKWFLHVYPPPAPHRQNAVQHHAVLPSPSVWWPRSPYGAPSPVQSRHLVAPSCLLHGPPLRPSKSQRLHRSQQSSWHTDERRTLGLTSTAVASPPLPLLRNGFCTSTPPRTAPPKRGTTSRGASSPPHSVHSTVASTTLRHKVGGAVGDANT